MREGSDRWEIEKLRKENEELKKVN